MPMLVFALLFVGSFPSPPSVMNSPTVGLRKTALHSLHKKLGARMAEFGGWDMPIEYSGIIQEHLAVRTAAGLFDISHMGEILIEGPESLRLIQHVTCNDASRLKDEQIQYSALLTPEGTFVDDILVHRFSADRYFLCVNASNAEKDFDWICDQNAFDAEVVYVSDPYSQLALQGPKALNILQPLVSIDLADIKYYWLKRGKIGDLDCLITRTGYTGEDGFELYFDPDSSERVWTQLMDAGSGDGLIPTGLGARNTLRLEAKMALYGHEITDQTTPWEADLAWVVKLDKGDFLGKEALIKQKGTGIQKKLVGFEMVGKGIGRDGYPVLINGQQAGVVTSGGPSPYLKKNIGLAYVPVSHSDLGKEIEIQVRTQTVPARIVKTPFYTRPK
ncbi:MAG TPA: glycine cleavage system aminomethyltransferase GcvT [Terriglobia bacterium]|nr:glycine cleavage system aminomethyltransferase GcvT [Terriglobia bacterium]